jgi:predicted PurR-regulated permease PerM
MATSLDPAASKLQRAAYAVVVIWGIAKAGPLLVPLSVSALLAFLVAPLARALRRARLPEWAAVVLSALALPVAGLAVGIFFQTQSLVRDLPKLIAALDRELPRLAVTGFGQRLHLDGQLDVSVLIARAGVNLERGVSVALAGVSAVVGATSSIAIVILFAVLMIAARGRVRRAADGVLSSSLIDQAVALIERFLVIRLLIAAVIAGADFAGLAAFGIDYAFLLAAFLGFMTLIPAVGFIIAVIPPIAVAIAMGHSGWNVVAMTGFLVFMSFIEGNVLSPKLLGRSLNLSTLATFVAIFAGGLLWGVPGMLLSLPVLAVARVALLAVPGADPWAELLSGAPHPRRPKVEKRRAA